MLVYTDGSAKGGLTWAWCSGDGRHAHGFSLDYSPKYPHIAEMLPVIHALEALPPFPVVVVNDFLFKNTPGKIKKPG